MLVNLFICNQTPSAILKQKHVKLLVLFTIFYFSKIFKDIYDRDKTTNIGNSDTVKL